MSFCSPRVKVDLCFLSKPVSPQHENCDFCFQYFEPTVVAVSTDVVLIVTQEEKCFPKFNSRINVICGIEVAYKKLEQFFAKAADYLLLQFY